MNALNIPARQVLSRRHSPDLDGAYNDGFEPGPRHSMRAVLGRWMVLTWSVVAWTVGSVVLVRAIVTGLIVAGNELRRALA
jgi:hypothetical protein